MLEKKRPIFGLLFFVFIYLGNFLEILKSLLEGFDGRWRELLAALSDDFVICLFDRPGSLIASSADKSVKDVGN